MKSKAKSSRSDEEEEYNINEGLIKMIINEGRLHQNKRRIMKPLNNSGMQKILKLT